MWSWSPCWQEAMCAEGSPCEFKGKDINCGIERDTQRQIWEHMPAHAVTLEVGARFGTVSCAISLRQRGSGLRLSVEPDGDAFLDLNANVERNRCPGMQVNGVVSHTAAFLQRGDGYNNMVSSSAQGDVRGYTPAELEEQLAERLGEPDKALRFDTLLLDCEGCAFNFVEEHKDFMKDKALQRVFLEADISSREDYEAAFLPKMCAYGFDVKVDEPNTTCCPDIRHIVFWRGGRCAEAAGMAS